MEWPNYIFFLDNLAPIWTLLTLRVVLENSPKLRKISYFPATLNQIVKARLLRKKISNC